MRKRFCPLVVIIAAGSCALLSAGAAGAASHGKWHFKKQQSGAMLGWSSDASSEELDGVVFNCEKKGASIATSIDLDQSFKVGVRANITLMAGTKEFEIGGLVEDGLNGPMMTVDLKPDMAKTLLTQHSAIGVRLHSPQQKEPYVYPPAPMLFKKFLVGCGVIS